MEGLNKNLVKMKVHGTAGMLRASAYIREDMERTPPLIPLDTGNLRASWFTSAATLGTKPLVIFGFNSNYAFFVHENMEPTIKWKRPGSGPKFFESAVKRNESKMLQIIKSNIKL